MRRDALFEPGSRGRFVDLAAGPLRRLEGPLAEKAEKLRGPAALGSDADGSTPRVVLGNDLIDARVAARGLLVEANAILPIQGGHARVTADLRDQVAHHPWMQEGEIDGRFFARLVVVPPRAHLGLDSAEVW